MKIIKFGLLILHLKKKYEAKSKTCITRKLIQFFCCHFSAPDDNFPQCWRTFLHHSPFHAFERRRFHVSCNVQWAIQTWIGQRRKIFYWSRWKILWLYLKLLAWRVTSKTLRCATSVSRGGLFPVRATYSWACILSICDPTYCNRGTKKRLSRKLSPLEKRPFRNYATKISQICQIRRWSWLRDNCHAIRFWKGLQP